MTFEVNFLYPLVCYISFSSVGVLTLPPVDRWRTAFYARSGTETLRTDFYRPSVKWIWGAKWRPHSAESAVFAPGWDVSHDDLTTWNKSEETLSQRSDFGPSENQTNTQNLSFHSLCANLKNNDFYVNNTNKSSSCEKHRNKSLIQKLVRPITWPACLFTRVSPRCSLLWSDAGETKY